MKGPNSLTIWHFSDNTNGHDQQSLGLIGALSKRINIDSYTISVPIKRTGLLDALRGRFSFANDLPQPDLIIGAGHRTHIPMLAARMAHGGKIIVLMKPSLPLWMFDLCLVPEHDDVEAKKNHSVQLTKGVLNTIQPSFHHDVDKGLFLIGGPCKHNAWSDEHVSQQILFICEQQAHMQFELTNSRRTPMSFLHKIESMAIPNLTITSYHNTDSNWVSKKLTRSHQAWVTGDSVSMIYESLTAGAAVGIINIPMRKNSRVNRGLLSLIESKHVLPFQEWSNGSTLSYPHASFNESARCAESILTRWYPPYQPLITDQSNNTGDSVPTSQSSVKTNRLQTIPTLSINNANSTKTALKD